MIGLSKSSHQELILKKSYEEAVCNNGLISLVTDIHSAFQDEKSGKGKAVIATSDVVSVIERTGSLWKSKGQATGHRAFRHEITGIVIGYEGHGPKEICGSHLEGLHTNLQTHLNILCNDIFAYNTKNWKTPPNYPESVARYNKWLVQKK